MSNPEPTDQGFTLAELLIVISVFLILMVLVIPVLQQSPRRVNETAAINALRTLNDMEGQYSNNYPQLGFACSLKTLGGKAGTPASPDSAQLISPDLASGHNNGYIFTLTGCDPSATQHGSYQITAVPDSVGHTGNRGFCTDENAKIRYDTNGGTNCTELLR